MVLTKGSMHTFYFQNEIYEAFESKCKDDDISVGGKLTLLMCKELGLPEPAVANGRIKWDYSKDDVIQEE